MKHIIFIKGKLDDKAYEAIVHELENTRLEYTLSRFTQSISVEGSNDSVYLAKSCIQQAGYEVE